MIRERKLTAHQARFVQEYLIDLNANAALRRTGSKAMSSGAASRLMSKPTVMAAIAAGKADLRERTGVTQEVVVAGLLHEARLEGQDSSHAARVSAWAHLGKHLGMFIERIQVEELETLSDDALRAKALALIGRGNDSR